jgi:hypothetical protein
MANRVHPFKPIRVNSPLYSKPIVPNVPIKLTVLIYPEVKLYFLLQKMAILKPPIALFDQGILKACFNTFSLIDLLLSGQPFH